MSAPAPEPRMAVMILVEASWEDQNGDWQTVPARMEDKSAGGACIRLNTRIAVGSKIRVRWHWSQFSGTSRYCRSEGKDFLVGIQRDKTTSPALDGPIPRHVSVLQGAVKSSPPVSTADIPSPPQAQESRPSATPAVERKPEEVRIAPSGVRLPAAVTGQAIDRNPSETSPPTATQTPETELQTKPPAQEKNSGKERTFMGHKWLARAPWHRQDGLSGNGNGTNKDKEKDKRNRAPQAHLPSGCTADSAGEDATDLEVEFLSTENIYREAGIVAPRKGYSIKKVVEMLHSEHILGLANEMKRAAVLMALNAAGVPIDDVLNDARARQEALDSYEAEQKEQVEAEWARKAEENLQIEADLERAQAYYKARIDRNLESVAREKAAFGNWLTLKQQETQSMSEAVELCSKSALSAPGKESSTALPSQTKASRPAEDAKAGSLAVSTAAR